MKILLLFLFIGFIGVECSIYYIIPSELTGNVNRYGYENNIFFGLVSAYLIIWCWCVSKKTYAKESHEGQWSKFSMVIFAFVLQLVWYIILSYFRNRTSIIFSGIISCISFILPIQRIFEANNYKVKILFLIVSVIQVLIILWVSLEFIIYEKFVTYSWIVAYYTYPIYIAIFAGLFVRFLRINEGTSLPPS